MPVDEHRRKFKNAGKADELRRRRAEGSVELRKTRKDDNLMKRRNIEVTSDNESCSDTCEISFTDSDEKPKELKTPKQFLPLEQCIEILKSGVACDSARLFDAVEGIRRSLSRQTNPAIQTVIEANIVPQLVQCLISPDPKLQFEAAWALTNISSGTSSETQSVVSAGAVPFLVALLDSPELYVADQACWALSNIAGDSAALRDLVIGAQALDPLIRLSKKPISIEMLRIVMWTLSNLCRHRTPPPPVELLHTVLPVLIPFLSHKDTSVVTDACWAIAYLSDSTEDRIEPIIEQGAVPRMVALLNSTEISHIAPALRCLGNIVTGNDMQTQVVVDSGVLTSILPAIIRSEKSLIIKEAMWLLSNIAAGNHAQIKAIFDANLIPVVLEVLKKCDHRSQYEAVWVLANVINGGTGDHICYLLQFGETIFGVLCDRLKSNEVRTICLVLDCISYLLQAADKIDRLEPCVIAIEECGGLDQIESLQSHTNEDVYRKALGIIECYFNSDDEESLHQSKKNGEGSTMNGENFDMTPVSDPQFTF